MQGKGQDMAALPAFPAHSRSRLRARRSGEIRRFTLRGGELRRRTRRQEEVERTALAYPALQPDLSAVCLHRKLTEGQPQARSGLPSRFRYRAELAEHRFV